MVNLNKNFIQLTPELYNSCIAHLNKPHISEKTKALYKVEIDKLFQSKVLTQEKYNSIYLKDNYYRAVLKLVCDVAEFNDLGDYKYKVMKVRQRKRLPEPQVWHENEILEMISKVEDYGLLIECAYYIGAGLRFSSAIMLRWDDFIWEDWVDNIHKMGKCKIHAKGDKYKILMVNPILMQKLHNIAKSRGKLLKNIPYKSSTDDLFMFVDKTTIYEIEEKYRKENFENMLDGQKNKIRVIEKARNEIIRKKHYLVDYKLRKLAKLMNKKSIKFHSIRHSAATNLLKKGFKLKTIQDQLMHNSIATTERYLSLENIDIENEFNDKLSI
jgi:integrase